MGQRQAGVGVVLVTGVDKGKTELVSDTNSFLVPGSRRQGCGWGFRVGGRGGQSQKRTSVGAG